MVAASACALIINLVGGQDHGFPTAAQHLDDGLVDVLGPNGRVDNKDDGIRGGDSELRLLGNSGSHSLGIWCPATVSTSTNWRPFQVAS